MPERTAAAKAATAIGASGDAANGRTIGAQHAGAGPASQRGNRPAGRLSNDRFHAPSGPMPDDRPPDSPPPSPVAGGVEGEDEFAGIEPTRRRPSPVVAAVVLALAAVLLVH